MVKGRTGKRVVLMKAPHFDTLAIVNERTTGAMLFGMGKVVKDCAIATAQDNGYVQY